MASRTVYLIAFLLSLSLLANAGDPVGNRAVVARASEQPSGPSLAASQPLQLAFERKGAPGDLGLYVPGVDEATITLNGRVLEVDPVLRKDGAVWWLPKPTLTSGTNALRIEGMPKDGTWSGTTVFELLDFDTLHFGSAFAEVEPMNVALEAAHPQQGDYDVLSYDCYWQPSMSASSITSSTITIRAKSLVSNLNSMMLDFDRNGGSMVISRVDRGEGTSAVTPNYDDTNYRMTVPLTPAPTLNQEFVVRIAYSGTPRSGDFYRRLVRPYTRTTHNGVPVVYTASQPYGGRRWWPSKDWPEDKATATIRVNVPANASSGFPNVVVSNGLLSRTEDAAGGTKTWVWDCTSPIATYLISFSVTDYVFSNANYMSADGSTQMPIQHAIYRENNTSAREANGAAGTREVLTFFRDTFGEYPFLGEKYATASWNISFGIEHQTCTGMPGAEDYGVSESVGNGLTRRNIHELAHMWYGDSVTYDTFDHVWLGEAFATYAEALWFEHVGGISALHSYVAAWTYNETTPIVDSSADSYSTSISYRRGAWVLHMLRHVIGDAAFFQTLKNFASNYKHSTAVSADFESVAEATSGRNLDAFFRQWLYRPYVDGAVVPVYGFGGNCNRSGGNWDLNLTVNQSQTGSVPFTMPLDYRVTYANGTNAITTVDNSALASTVIVPLGTIQPLEVDLDPENWVLNRQTVSISTVGLPSATAGQAYSRSLRASGGTAGYSWSFAGSVPAWLSLSSSGVMSATSPVAGLYSVPVRVTDGGSATRSTTLQLEVAGSGVENALEY